MKNFFRFFISMPMMGFLTLMLAFSMAAATFIENDFGATVAHATVYNAWWFELLLLLFMIDMIGNMIINKVYQKKKFSLFLFHFAFFIIFLGAAVTRYISYEGMMHIREGESTDKILSSETYVYGSIHVGTREKDFSYRASFIPGKKNHFKRSAKLQGKKYMLELVKYIPNAKKMLIPDSQGEPYLSIVINGTSGKKEILLKEGGSTEIDGQTLGFNHDRENDDFYIYQENANLYFISHQPVVNMNMAVNSRDTLQKDEPHLLIKGDLYITSSFQLVLENYYDKSRYNWVASNGDRSLPAALMFKISNGTEQKELTLLEKTNRQQKVAFLSLGNATLSLAYGSRLIQLPFSLYLKDFQLQRYPGSNSPSSYASKVILIDPNNHIKMPFRIYMNHTLHYEGFKFFQSSYDTDEKGTILSVNHDSLGTTLTYIGYFLMALGMVISIFNKNSRFMKLAKKTGVSGSSFRTLLIPSVLALGLTFSSFRNASAQEAGISPQRKTIPAVAARDFSTVLVQDQGGRIKPFYAIASDVLRKTLWKNEYAGQNPVQVVLGMYFYPENWQHEPMIRVSGDILPGLLGIKGKFASYIDFFDPSKHFSYKLNDYVQKAYQKRPVDRNKFDQDVMKVDERLNVCYLVYSGTLFRIFPVKGDPQHPWYTPKDAGSFAPKGDSLFVSTVLPHWISAINTPGGGTRATEIVKSLRKYQKLNGGSLIPSATKIRMEVFYEKTEVFGKLASWYGLIGFVLLIILFVKIIRQNISGKIFIKISTWLLLFGFLIHTGGLGVRWYISGHAPWSNGYESMIYIAWAAILAGLIFVKKTPFALAAAAILSALTLFVAHLSWMSPEITNLVPVLKSYWLTIHVSVITASYGFLGMGMIIGLLNLLLYIFKTNKNHQRIQQQIEILTHVNEMALILGVYFVSMGTFLGGVWANESWGRYWGWDPKETWALITALVYVFVVHMRKIPGLKGYFAFNVASVLAFFSVIMTYFGVNYYLTGLHSYAQGDSVPIPTFVYYSVTLLIGMIWFAWYKEKKFRKGK